MTTLADAVKRPEKRAARSAASRAEVFRLSESPSHLLRRVEQFAAEVFLKSELPDGVTLRQAVLLAAINEAEGASQSDLVRTTGVDRSTLAEMMARMERKGLITRSAAADDGRAKSVSLTRDGRARLEGALPAMREVDEALLAALPRNKRVGFKAALATLSETADAAHVEADEAQKVAKKAAKSKKKTAATKGGKRPRKKKQKSRR